MKIFITGIDGYLGWPLALYLKNRGHQVEGADIYYRRNWVDSQGSHSAIPIATMTERKSAFLRRFEDVVEVWEIDLMEHTAVLEALKAFGPDAIVHLGEMPSAPFSMANVDNCRFTQANNILGTLNILWAMKEVCPKAHLVKLGTMGEYGTPNVDIPEGEFDIEYRGRKDTLPFPRQPGSWYHLTKVHDSHNVKFACKVWDLRSTDIMQGVVFGTWIDEMGADPDLRTRFDFDQCFGTVINRYCAQAVIGHPLTPFGEGFQRRGFLPLKDSMQCLNIAIENPPQPGEYRTFNQFEDVYDVTELALKVQEAAGKLGMKVEVRNLENPRKEAEKHYYNPDHKHLLDLGYQPSGDIEMELISMLRGLSAFKDRIQAKKDVLIPDIRWDGTQRRSEFIKKD